MEKPEFPKPRIIREDFLPNEPMKNYRIKRVIEQGTSKYYPQKKILWWWVDICGLGRYYWERDFSTLEEAKQALHKKVYGEKRKVEYIYEWE